MEDFYRFPEIVNPSSKNLCRTPYEQAQKIIEKADEVFEEVRERNMIEMGVETMDVIHVCETLLRRNFTEDEVQALRDECERKNRVRGFYDAN